ncbi:hypothetical protein AGMMS50262_19900 [Bacteroidia bacterium]|nr:hypothetical protein AGMMS50262_19900 [Bacteroidia bacterium]
MKVNFNRVKAHSFMSKALCTLIIATAAVSSISCSKDDDNDNGSLAGTSWQYVYVKTNISSFYLQLKFTSGTDGNIQTMMSSNGVVTPATQPFNFTYGYDGKNGTLHWGGSEPLDFTVSSNKLTFDENTAVAVGSVPLGGVVFIKQ